MVGSLRPVAPLVNLLEKPTSLAKVFLSVCGPDTSNLLRGMVEGKHKGPRRRSTVHGAEVLEEEIRNELQKNTGVDRG